jgi:hypothetical protein
MSECDVNGIYWAGAISGLIAKTIFDVIWQLKERRRIGAPE